MLVCLMGACQETSPPKTAFYHWKSQFRMSAEEGQFLDLIDNQRIYLRLMDVDQKNDHVQVISPNAPKTQPFQGTAHHLRGELNLPSSFQAPAEVVPVVYLTVDALDGVDISEAKKLAEAVGGKILQKMEGLPFAEVQMDHDWNQSTRLPYFAFLNELRNHLPDSTSLSATIRLHQVKYQQMTGIPPVDKGLLMYYNMSSLMNPDSKNTILDLEVAGDYHVGFDTYPIPLDVALPLYAQGVGMRLGNPIYLLPGLRSQELQDKAELESLAKTRYRVKKSHYLNGQYVYAGDEIRVEEVSEALLAAAVDNLQDLLPHPPEHLIFYHLDSTIVSHYDPAFLLNLAQSWP